VWPAAMNLADHLLERFRPSKRRRRSRTQARRLFDVPIHTAFRSFVPFKYDVAPDGRFLIVVRASQEPPPPLVLVLNWQAGLKK